MNKKAIIISVVVVLVILLLTYLAWPETKPATRNIKLPEPTKETAPVVRDTTPTTWIKYIKISKSKEIVMFSSLTYINLGELIVLDKTGKNIARGAKVTTSSDYNAGQFPASNFTDGKNDTVMQTQGISPGKPQWVEVELPAPITEKDLVNGIEVWNKPGNESGIVGAVLQIIDNLGAIRKEWQFDKAALKYSFYDSQVMG